MNNEAIIQSAKKKFIFFRVRSFPIQQRVIFFLCSVFWSHRKKNLLVPLFCNQATSNPLVAKKGERAWVVRFHLFLCTHILGTLQLFCSLSQTHTHIGCAHTHWLNHTRTQARKILAFPFHSIPAYQRQFHSSSHLPDEKKSNLVQSEISLLISSRHLCWQTQKAKSERDPKREVVDWNWLVCQESRGSSIIVTPQNTQDWGSNLTNRC